MPAAGVVCPYPVVVPHSNRYAVAALCGLTVPRSVAATGETSVAAAAPAPGATSAVVKTWSAPAVVPASELATRRKWELVFGASPLRAATTGCGVGSRPTAVSAAGAVLPYAGVSPHSKR